MNKGRYNGPDANGPNILFFKSKRVRDGIAANTVVTAFGFSLLALATTAGFCFLGCSPLLPTFAAVTVPQLLLLLYCSLLLVPFKQG